LEESRGTCKGNTEDVLKDANLVFVTGGWPEEQEQALHPGSAQVSKDQGAIVIGMVTTRSR